MVRKKKKKRRYAGFSSREIEFFVTFVFGILVGFGSNVSSDLFMRGLFNCENNIDVGLILLGFIVLLIVLLSSFCVFNRIKEKGFLLDKGK